MNVASRLHAGDPETFQSARSILVEGRPLPLANNRGDVLGTIAKDRRGQYRFEDTPLPGGINTVEEYLTGLPEDIGRSGALEEARRLNRRIMEERRERQLAEQRAEELLREALGPEKHRELKDLGRIRVRSRDGNTYWIRDNGDVLDENMIYRCTQVKLENLPKADEITAKYLYIRDAPGHIETLTG